MPNIREDGILLTPDRRKLPLKPEELMRKVLDGERDFSYISLKRGCDLSKYEGYHEMNTYLARQDLARDPVIITGSSLQDIIAPGLYVPHVKADCVYFGAASLIGANVAHGRFYASHFEEGSRLYFLNAPGAVFESADIFADLWFANLSYAIFSKAKMRRSILFKTNVFKSDFSRADLMEIMQLEEAENVHTANFNRAKVSHKLKDYLAGVLDRETTVIVEAEEIIGRKS